MTTTPCPHCGGTHDDARMMATSARWRLLQDCRNLLAAQLAEARAERDKLRAFKAWVHGYLDAQGVPHHPPGTHGAAGCRIGDRMDWLMDRLRSAEAEMAGLRSALEPFAKIWNGDQDGTTRIPWEALKQADAALRAKPVIDLATLEKASRPEPEQPRS